MIKPGVYKLAHDVTNPKPDRRTHDFPQRALWTAGLIVVVNPAEPREVVGGKVVERADGKVEVFERGDYSTRAIKPHHDTYEAKLAALAPALEKLPEEDFRSIFRDDLLSGFPSRGAAYSILAKLYDAGVVTREQILDAYNRVEQEA